jgi:hypothetical protein
MIAKMIEFFYNTRYNDDRGIDEEDITDQPVEANSDVAVEAISNVATIGAGPLITNAKMYILGDKYDIESLKNFAARKYGEVVKEPWYNDTFAESVELVYSNIAIDDNTLKSVIINAATSKISQFLMRGDFIRLLQHNGDIATDILLSTDILSTNKPRACIKCRGYSYAVCNHCQSQL